MARDFSARTDIDNTNPTDFPSGRLLNSNPPSARNGTAIIEEVFGDMFQLFLKLLRDASITPNGNADTDATSQYLDALVAKIRETTASLTEAGTAELATQAEVDAGSDATRIVTPSTLASRINSRLATAVFDMVTSGLSVRLARSEIGDWDMDTNASVVITTFLGLPANTPIFPIGGIIRNDAADTFYTINGTSSASDVVNDVAFQTAENTGIRIVRRATGFFDSPDFNSTSFNRGWIYVLYDV